MSAISNLFQGAQLAEAAYADLSSAVGSQSNLAVALDVANKETFDGSFSTAQAAALTKGTGVDFFSLN